MAGFNFFKIYQPQKNNLQTLLSTKGITLTDCKTINESGLVFECELYFSSSPRSRPIKWVNELQKEYNVSGKYVESYSAVLLISFDNVVFAVSFGAAHFYVSRFADFEFGIAIASRILENFKIKNSREFSGIKTKSIETYLEAKDLFYDAGEAVNYIKGTPANEAMWGKTVSCGQSVFLRKRNFTVANIHQLCVQLESALQFPTIKEIPTSVLVKDLARCSQLNEKLAEDIRLGHYMISISQQQLSGVAFLFSDQYDFKLSYRTGTVDIHENTPFSVIVDFVNKYFKGNFTELLKSDVIALEDGRQVYSKPFINFIDYIDCSDNYFLEDGRWFQFDNNYLSNVRNEVDKIEFYHSSEVAKFDEPAYDAWKAIQTENNKYYRERYLNDVVLTQLGYVNHDRSLDIFEGASVEIADLIKGDTVYIVKLGTVQTLGYAIDQASAAIKVLERQKFILNVNASDVQIKKICLWLFFERVNKLSSISDVNSLIFLMKLAAWRKIALLAGLQASICVSYK